MESRTNNPQVARYLLAVLGELYPPEPEPAFSTPEWRKKMVDETEGMKPGEILEHLDTEYRARASKGGL